MIPSVEVKAEAKVQAKTNTLQIVLE